MGIGPGWRAAPAFAAMFCACTIPLAARSLAGKLPASPERHGARGLLRRRLYVLFVAVIAIDIAAEAGFVGWIATYVDEAAASRLARRRLADGVLARRHRDPVPRRPASPSRGC